MIKQLSLVFSFIRDIFFEDPKELKLGHSKFHTTKVMTFLLIVASISLNCFLVNRLFMMGSRITELNKVTIACESVSNSSNESPVVPKSKEAVKPIQK